MSGHSKWATIKRAKGATDIKRGAAFTKLARAITVAARSGGGDQTMNFKLRLAIDKARDGNMPKDTIERAIKRGTGELEGAQIESLTYECFGPGGVALIVEALTDNKNRTVSNLKHILQEHGGNLGSANSVMWMFERKGVIRLPAAGLDPKTREELELKIIETGAQDIKDEDGFLTIYTAADQLQEVKEKLEKIGQKVEHADTEFVAKESVAIDESVKSRLEKLFEALDADDDVQDFYTNAQY